MGQQITAVDGGLDEVTADDAVLVAGPPMTGKYELLLQLVANRATNAIFITTKHRAPEITEDYREVAGDVPDERIGVVDCVSRQAGLDVEQTDTVKYVDSPENLTQVGVRFTELFESFTDADGQGTVGVHSLSNLLMHADVKTVYQFLQVLMGQVRGNDWSGVAAVDEETVAEDELATLKHHFDAVVRTRETEGVRELRVRGADRYGDWQPF